MLTVTPFLWLHGDVSEAAQFYVGLFDGEVLSQDLGPDMQSATIRMLDQNLHLFSAEGGRQLTEAFSLMVTCSTQQEIDRLWDALVDGGTPSRCGWLTDRFGVTWQIIPEHLQEWLADPAVVERMLQMVKLDIAGLRGD